MILVVGGEEIPQLLRVLMIRDEFPITVILNEVLSERILSPWNAASISVSLLVG